MYNVLPSQRMFSKLRSTLKKKGRDRGETTRKVRRTNDRAFRMKSKYGKRAINQFGMQHPFRIREEKTAFYARRAHHPRPDALLPTFSVMSDRPHSDFPAGRGNMHTADFFRVYAGPIRVDCVIPSPSLPRPAA